MDTLDDFEDATQVYRLDCRVSELPRELRALAEKFDGRRTLAEAGRAAGLSLTRALMLASRLSRCGAVVTVSSARPPLKAFSTAEEAFFAAELGEELVDEEPPAPSRMTSLLGRLKERIEEGLHIPTIAREGSTPSA